MLEFPKQKALLRKKHALKILYAPALLLSIFLLFLSVVQPRATSGLNQLTILLSGLFIVGYFGGVAVMLTHSYVRATPQERSQYGLHLVLGGILLGIIPVTVAVVFRILAPKLVLPGSNYYFLTILLVPAALIAAIMRPRREEESGRGFERVNLEQQGR